MNQPIPSNPSNPSNLEVANNPVQLSPLTQRLIAQAHQHNRDIATLFSTTALPTSLLCCSAIPATPTNAYQHIQHYALATRLALLHKHWTGNQQETRLQLDEWYRHVTLLHQTAAEQAISENNTSSAQQSTSNDNALVPWAPFTKWLEIYADAMKDDFWFYGEDNHHSPIDMAGRKVNLMSELERIVFAEREAAREGLEGVLEAMNLCGFERELKRCLEKVEAEVDSDVIGRQCFDEGGDEFGY
jgi:hypothetical protein